MSRSFGRSPQEGGQDSFCHADNMSMPAGSGGRRSSCRSCRSMRRRLSAIPVGHGNGASVAPSSSFPPPLTSYTDSHTDRQTDRPPVMSPQVSHYADDPLNRPSCNFGDGDGRGGRPDYSLLQSSSSSAVVASSLFLPGITQRCFRFGADAPRDSRNSAEILL